MNLITKTTIFYLLVASLVFSVGGVVAYNLIMQEVKMETDYELEARIRQVIHALEEGVPEKYLTSEKVSILHLASLDSDETRFQFADTIAPHPYIQDRTEAYRKVMATTKVNSQPYQISMMDVFIESDDIYESVVRIMTRLFILLGATLLILSFLITRWLFLPFQKTLDRIQAFNLKKQDSLALPVTTTKEFKQLNTFIAQMVAKARRDYLSMKEFSENASHEIQTPLSIAQGKLELLLETPNLSHEQLKLIHDSNQSLSRLSKLGEALLLLTKIDNKEFIAQASINLTDLLEKITQNFRELAELKGLYFEKNIQQDIQVKIDPALADILLSNLLKNALRHNVKEGWIKVYLTKEKLSISNTGLPPNVPTDQLFKRFQKSLQTENSLGLGLAIVKKICDVNNFTPHYDFADGIHEISVKFC